MSINQLIDENFMGLLSVKSTVPQFVALPNLLLNIIGDAIGFDADIPEEIYQELALLLNHKAAIKSGSVDLTPFPDRQSYIDSLEEMMIRLKRLNTSIFGLNKEKYFTIIRRTDELLQDLRLSSKKRFLRPQPFGIIITGNPGTGKSATAIKLATKVMKVLGTYRSPDQICVLNESDEYQSEFRTDHKAVIFDDLGATNVGVVPTDYTRKVIDFINNIPKTALNPHLELKGNVWIEPDVVVATTNMPVPFRRGDSGNAAVMICPEALNRRFLLKIFQSGYNEYSILTDTPPMSTEKGMDTPGKKCTYHDLEAMIEELVPVHFDAQNEYIDMCYKEISIESPPIERQFDLGTQKILQSIVTFFTSCSLLNMLIGKGLSQLNGIISFQESMRYAQLSYAIRGDIKRASVLSLFRFSAALLIQEIKNNTRKFLYASHNFLLPEVYYRLPIRTLLMTSSGYNEFLQTRDWKKSVYVSLAPTLIHSFLRYVSWSSPYYMVAEYTIPGALNFVYQWLEDFYHQMDENNSVETESEEEVLKAESHTVQLHYSYLDLISCIILSIFQWLLTFNLFKKPRLVAESKDENKNYIDIYHLLMFSNNTHTTHSHFYFKEKKFYIVGKRDWACYPPKKNITYIQKLRNQLVTWQQEKLDCKSLSTFLQKFGGVKAKDGRIVYLSNFYLTPGQYSKGDLDLFHNVGNNSLLAIMPRNPDTRRVKLFPHGDLLIRLYEMFGVKIMCGQYRDGALCIFPLTLEEPDIHSTLKMYFSAPGFSRKYLNEKNTSEVFIYENRSSLYLNNFYWDASCGAGKNRDTARTVKA